MVCGAAVRSSRVEQEFSPYLKSIVIVHHVPRPAARGHAISRLCSAISCGGGGGREGAGARGMITLDRDTPKLEGISATERVKECFKRIAHFDNIKIVVFSTSVRNTRRAGYCFPCMFVL